jgi:diguanylate cyclase (GGDEF)-like protein
MASESPTTMSQPHSALDDRPLPAIITHLARFWIFTGFIASMVAVGVALLVARTGANILSQILVAVACGTLTAFALAPWRHVQALMNRAQLLGRVTELVVDMQTGDRTDSIRQLATRNDEVGELCQAVDDLLGTFVSQRVRAHSMTRTMHDTIRKETSRATAALKREAMTDSLTGLGNRRALEEFEERMHVMTPTKPDTLVAAMVIDVDDFKQLNDTAGHRQGDECLKFIGTVLQASTRREDCALRLGGDEFLVMMLDRSREEMKAVADRVISLLRQMPWPGGAGQPPTVSVGMAEAALSEVESLEEIVAAADAAMYQAKKTEGSSIGLAWEVDGLDAAGAASRGVAAE